MQEMEKAFMKAASFSLTVSFMHCSKLTLALSALQQILHTSIPNMVDLEIFGGLLQQILMVIF